MLPKKNRLKGAQIRKKRLKIRTFSGKFITASVFSIISSGKEPSFAIVISSKITKSKPERNLLRRRIYSILRESKPRLRLNNDFIIYPNKTALKANFADLKEEIAKLS